MIKRNLLGLSAAALIAGTTMLAPTPASAHPLWLVPALIGAGVLGAGTGAAVASNSHTTVVETTPAPVETAPAPTVVAPSVTETQTCHLARERIDGVWRRVQICD